jgi:hypothetical protein
VLTKAAANWHAQLPHPCDMHTQESTHATVSDTSLQLTPPRQRN